MSFDPTILLYLGAIGFAYYMAQRHSGNFALAKAKVLMSRVEPKASLVGYLHDLIWQGNGLKIRYQAAGAGRAESIGLYWEDGGKMFFEYWPGEGRGAFGEPNWPAQATSAWTNKLLVGLVELARAKLPKEA